VSSANFPAMTHLHVEPGPPVPESDLPRVTVVILNFNGRQYLGPCLESLERMEYPPDRLEVVLVDNGSDDGSVAHTKSRWPWVRVLENARNVGFAGGCNQGAAAATEAAVIAFLNNDVRVHEHWLARLVEPIVRGACAATTSKMLSWDGSRIDSAGGAMNCHGVGFQEGYRDVPAPQYDVARKTLFPCGGAMAVDARVFRECGGFDAEFFAYYEDVDLGWRLWVLGHEVHYVPESVCWHVQHGTSRAMPREAVRLLQVRNPLLACVKNYDDAHLKQILPVALALMMRRMLLVSGLESDRAYRIEHARPVHVTGLLGRTLARVRRKLSERERVKRKGVADLLAANDLLGNWTHWMARREEVQAARRRSDEDIFGLFLRPMWSVEDDPGYRELFEGSAEFFGVDALFADHGTRL